MVKKQIIRVCPSCSSVYQLDKNVAVACCRVCGRILTIRNTRTDTHRSKTVHPAIILRYRKKKLPEPTVVEMMPFLPISIIKQLEARKMADIVKSMMSAASAIQTVVDSVEANGENAIARIKEKEAEVEKRLAALDGVIDTKIDTKIKAQDEKFSREIFTLRGEITKQSRALTATLNEKHEAAKKGLDRHLANHDRAHQALMEHTGKKSPDEKKE